MQMENGLLLKGNLISGQRFHGARPVDLDGTDYLLATCGEMSLSSPRQESTS